jgi:hypothetical protein
VRTKRIVLCIFIFFSLSIEPLPGELGYRERGNRCEGLFKQKIAATIQIVAFTGHYETINPGKNKNILIKWTPYKNQDIHIRAFSTLPGLYYQMDAVPEQGEKEFLWPPTVLNRIELPGKDLGILCWTETTVGEREELIFLPCSVQQEKKIVQDNFFRVTFKTCIDLSSVTFSLSQLDSRGNTLRFIHENKDAGYSLYPKDYPVTINIPTPGQSGLYAIKILFTLKNKRIMSRHLIIYYEAGSSP